MKKAIGPFPNGMSMTLDELDTIVQSLIDRMDEANDMRSESADDVRRILVASSRT